MWKILCSMKKQNSGSRSRYFFPVAAQITPRKNAVFRVLSPVPSRSCSSSNIFGARTRTHTHSSTYTLLYGRELSTCESWRSYQNGCRTRKPSYFFPGNFFLSPIIFLPVSWRPVGKEMKKCSGGVRLKLARDGRKEGFSHCCWIQRDERWPNGKSGKG